ncbi:hypothetical protein [Dactylosporangium sp. NPDC049140]|uniref:hypothetical protein n=1 Tax=Dactylosporangium sp. NPDC049140 TaxID=3155647 RepID=UPI003409FC41
MTRLPSGRLGSGRGGWFFGGAASAVSTTLPYRGGIFDGLFDGLFVGFVEAEGDTDGEDVGLDCGDGTPAGSATAATSSPADGAPERAPKAWIPYATLALATSSTRIA